MVEEMYLIKTEEGFILEQLKVKLKFLRLNI